MARIATTVLIVVALATTVLGHTWLSNSSKGLKRSGDNNFHCRVDAGYAWDCQQTANQANGPDVYDGTPDGTCQTPIICYGPCDRSSERSDPSTAQTAARGEEIRLEWTRNNHHGGFIRIAWAPYDQSDEHVAYNQNVQQMSCHETGSQNHPLDGNPAPCQSENYPTDPYGSDGGVERVCSNNIVVPDWLPDGLWTMQHAWFAGGFGFTDYYSCLDLQISGGNAYDPDSKANYPVFVGDDHQLPGQDACLFDTVDRIHENVVQGNIAYTDNTFPRYTPTTGQPSFEYDPRFPMLPMVATEGNDGSKTIDWPILPAGNLNIAEYILEVATDAEFANVVDTVTVDNSDHDANGMVTTTVTSMDDDETEYFLRVRTTPSVLAQEVIDNDYLNSGYVNPTSSTTAWCKACPSDSGEGGNSGLFGDGGLLGDVSTEVLAIVASTAVLIIVIIVATVCCTCGATCCACCPCFDSRVRAGGKGDDFQGLTASNPYAGSAYDDANYGDSTYATEAPAYSQPSAPATAPWN